MMSAEQNQAKPLVMSVIEAGQMLNCGKNKAYQLAREGVIPSLRLNGRIVVPRDRFMRWLNGEGNSNPSNE